MRNPTQFALIAPLCVLLAGCGAGALVEPGHRGVLFDPNAGGLKHDVLLPGYYPLGSCFLHRACSRVDDFDVSYSTHKEDVRTTSSEGLSLTLKVAVIYRPIISELYELDTEVGQNYYDEVIGPEFRSAVRGVFARHAYGELQKANEKIEDEVELDVRRRVKGKHVEVASVTLEGVTYAPEIDHAVQAKLVGEQESARQKSALENEALRRKLGLEHEAEQQRLTAQAELQAKKNEHIVAEEQAAIDKINAENEARTRIIRAKAESEEQLALAKGHAAEARAQAAGVTPLTVMMHAYDALGELGGTNTSIMLGDWSRTPNFLFPRAGVFGLPAGYAPISPAVSAAPSAPATHSSVAPRGAQNPY